VSVQLREDRFSMSSGSEDERGVPDNARSDRPLPSWFVTGLVAAVVWCAAAGTVGVALLVAGWYEASVVAGAATLASLAAAIAAARGLGRRVSADHRAALVAVGLFVAFFAFAGAFHSEHLLADRDPAIYIDTGRSIARTHELKPKIQRGAFTDPVFGTTYGRYRPDFFPMLPVLLAMGWSVGGDTGLLLVGPLLGALGLLACYALAARVVSPRAALLVPAFLMIVPLQLWFARDAYSELLVQVVVLGGLWVFLEARAQARWGLALLSGALVASSALARIDALAIIVGSLALFAVQWIRADSEPESVPARRVVAAFGCALVGVTLIALVTTYNVAYGYVTSLGSQYSQLVGALVAAVLGAVAVIVIHRVRPGFGRWFAGRNYPFAAAVAASVGVFAWAYVWRPLPASDLPVVDPGRPVSPAVRQAIYAWHFSRSLHWFSAYIGVVGLVVAFVGFVVLASRARRGNAAAAAVFLVVVPVAVMYIARPSITPDQPWAMRRYLPVVIPGIAIALAVALQAGWRAARSMRASIARTAVGAAVVLVAAPAAAVPFVHARMQHGALAAVHHICRTAGDDGAILVFGARYLDIELPQTIRGFCGLPVAKSSTVDMVELARDWRALGRRLLVATAVPDVVLSRVPGATIVGHEVISDDDEPERVFDRAPRRNKAIPVEIWLLQMPANGS
jgi:hypothetical protein